MTVTITVTDVDDGKVDVFCDVHPPDVVGNTPCDMSRLVAWSMLFTAEHWLINSPVRRCGFNMSAKPDMLQALKQAEQFIKAALQESAHVSNTTLTVIRAAIAKAEGRL